MTHHFLLSRQMTTKQNTERIKIIVRFYLSSFAKGLVRNQSRYWWWLYSPLNRTPTWLKC